MNSESDCKKPSSSADTKHGTNTVLSGFSFKQLEEDDDGEDLAFYASKHHKIIDESKKDMRKDSERKSSASSLSSVSASENKSLLKSSTGKVAEKSKHVVKPVETSSFPIITATKAKLEISKDLFSNLKGKITDTIARTIEEFSGDSSSSSNPEKEKDKLLPHRANSQNLATDKKAKLLPDQKHSGIEVAATRNAELLPDSRINNHETADKCMESVFHYSASNPELGASKTAEDISAYCKLPDKCLSPQYSEPCLKNMSSSVKEMPSLSLVNRKASCSSQKGPFPSHSSNNIFDETSSMTSDVDDTFIDVTESSESGVLSTNKQAAGSSIHDFFSPFNDVADTKIHVLAKRFTIEPEEGFSRYPTVSTNDHSKSSSVVESVDKSHPSAHSFAAFSDAHFSFEKQIKEPQTSSNIVAKDKIFDTDRISGTERTSQMTSSSNIILQQFSMEDRVLPYQKFAIITVVLFAYLILPVPSYMCGFIMGALLASLCWRFYIWLMEKPRLLEPVVLPSVGDPQVVPETKITSEGEEFLYKGWMNQLENYDVVNYHLNKTHSILVTLEGSFLRLQQPKNAIPKRAMWDEVLPKPQFIDQQHYHLSGARVFLLPNGLVRKRIWSKKYPICIELTPIKLNEDVESKHNSSDSLLQEDRCKLSDTGEPAASEKCKHVLYLFARTCREKEEWYQRFSAASAGKPLANHILELKRVLSQTSPSLKRNTETKRHKREGSTDSASSSSSKLSFGTTEGESPDLLTFAQYMGRLMPSGSLSASSSPSHTSRDTSVDTAEVSKNSHRKDGEEIRVLNPGSPVSCDSQLFWVNALIGRCFFDFLRDKWWIGKVKEKLQKKLSKIHVPYLMEKLQVTDINMGSEVPGIRHASRPYIDERGFWVILDLAYAGGFQMTIETKVNLLKLKRSTGMSAHMGHSVDMVKSAVTDSDEEDSGESSTDDEEVPSSNEESSPSGGGTSKKFLRYLNKITKSKYFQHATEYKVIKRAMENVSNTPLILSVTVVSLVGKLALNIPPPASDRLWYGFLGNPHLRLSAKPQVGEHAITITHIIEWIEKKLTTEFQRVFVIPNMDDLIIPILMPGDNVNTSAS